MNKIFAVLAINVVLLLNVVHTLNLGTIESDARGGHISLEVKSMKSDEELNHAEELCRTMYKSLVDDADAKCIDKKHYRNFAFGAWKGDTLIAFVAILDVESSLKPTFSSLLNSNNVDEYGHAMNLMIRREYTYSGIGKTFALMVIKHYIKTHAETKKGIIAEVVCDFAGEQLAKVYEKYGLRRIGKREYTVAGNTYFLIVLAAKFEDLVLPSASAN